MADNTPAVQGTDTASEPKVVEQPEAVTKEDVEIPKFAKSLEAEATSEEAPTPQSEPTTDEQATLKKRLSGAISEVEKRNEEARRYVDLQTEIVKENNDLIHKVAATDPILANKVVAKVWGTQGIRSYKQLLERSKLEELKAENPEAYETRKELLEVKSRLADREAREQRDVKSKFFKDKGIIENEYDPNYRKVTEAFDSLNPTLVSEDYDKALKLAYSIAFAEEPMERVIEVPTIKVGGGSKLAPLPTPRVQVSDQSSWLASKLNEKLGYKINLNS